MSITTIAPNPNAFAHNPHYARGVADAYDEYMAGDNVHTLVRRSNELLDSPLASLPAELYVAGYANTVVGLLNGHINTITAQVNVAYTDRKQATR